MHWVYYCTQHPITIRLLLAYPCTGPVPGHTWAPADDRRGCPPPSSSAPPRSSPRRCPPGQRRCPWWRPGSQARGPRALAQLCHRTWVGEKGVKCEGKGHFNFNRVAGGRALERLRHTFSVSDIADLCKMWVQVPVVQQLRVRFSLAFHTGTFADPHYLPVAGGNAPLHRLPTTFDSMDIHIFLAFTRFLARSLSLSGRL